MQEASVRRQFKRFARDVAIIVGSFLAVLMIPVAIQIYWIVTATSSSDVRDYLSSNVSPRANADEIMLFLDQAGIEHGDVDTAGDSTLIRSRGYSPDTPVIFAIERKTWRTVFGCYGDVVIFFILDEQRELTETIVEESGTCF